MLDATGLRATADVLASLAAMALGYCGHGLKPEHFAGHVRQALESMPLSLS